MSLTKVLTRGESFRYILKKLKISQLRKAAAFATEKQSVQSSRIAAAMRFEAIIHFGETIVQLSDLSTRQRY